MSLRLAATLRFEKSVPIEVLFPTAKDRQNREYLAALTPECLIGFGFQQYGPIREYCPLLGTKMPNSLPTTIELQQIREIASRKLRQYSKKDTVIQECYLFDEEFLAGIRYQSGSICFLWKSTESSASIYRGELLIESVNVVPGQEKQRRAA